ncbi:MAG: hypothetical protein WCG01_01835 [bacterium]
MKKLTKIVLLVGAIIVASAVGLYVVTHLNKKVEVTSVGDYYDELAKKCESKNKYDDCCISSVGAMKAGNYKLSENNICGDGYVRNEMKCLDSYQWCEPIKK